ncbi:2OG-Fe(II) oxygenase [Xanthomonas sp. MUS 060]|uniref:2OG-Fe(II) oxygenase n=1 Tax=Xanthomonas sp. MUS 060 TaxID=1588031 RepID=UPI0005F2FDDA|nr:2OG-Fe(II) oxygenase [Xanthomonas sp. MUS 060]
MSDLSADFIEVFDGAMSREDCATILRRLRASTPLRPGEIDGGVFPELKHSHDLRISGLEPWREVELRLQQAVLGGLLGYLRKYPQTLISPLMLQVPGADGQAHWLKAEDFALLDDAALSNLARACLRPGTITLQWYAAGEGGYPYWHCELSPRDPNAETLHRHLFWTLYLNDDFQDGETEFLFQRRKIAPRAGSLLIAPTAFTHTHRGNRPRGGDQFIATSWILFQSAQALYPQE